MPFMGWRCGRSDVVATSQVSAGRLKSANDNRAQRGWAACERPAFACAQAFAPRFDPLDQIAPSAPSLTPSVLRARARNPPPPPAAVEDFAHDNKVLHHAEHGGGGLRRRRKTEGVVGQLALHALGAPLRKAFHVVEQGGHAAQAGDDLGERSGAALVRRRDARGVDVGQAKDLPGALVD